MIKLILHLLRTSVLILSEFVQRFLLETWHRGDICSYCLCAYFLLRVIFFLNECLVITGSKQWPSPPHTDLRDFHKHPSAGSFLYFRFGDNCTVVI